MGGEPTEKSRPSITISLWESFGQVNFPCGSAGKESPCSKPGFDPWVGKIPWRRERLPTSAFWPGEFHGFDSPWGGEE